MMNDDKTLLDILADKNSEATFVWPKQIASANEDDNTVIKAAVPPPPPRPKPRPAKSKSVEQPSQAKSLEQPKAPEKSITFSENLTIQRIIGEGGVGRVYLAYDEAIGRRVAVKELLVAEQNRQLENSFIHEAKITGKLEHPGIIPVYQLGYREDGRAYYVMRYVKGETLEEQLDKCQQSSAELSFNKRIKLLDTLINACDTLAYAHSKGVIHRDLKPSNIISGKFGETIILDWGLAQALDDGDDDFFRNVQAHQTNTYSDNDNTQGMGTPRYMAPEQLRGKAVKASDVYSLGVILFKIITGDLPYKGSPQEIQARLLNDKPSPSPNQYIGMMSPELGAICEKAMAKNPFDRFADAGELSYQLKAYRDGRMVNIYSYSKQELFRRFLAKNKFIVAMFILLLGVIVAGAIFSVHYAMQMDEARTKAEEALVSVTALGEQAQVQANIIANNINTSANELFANMKKTASQLASSSPNEQRKLLEALHNQYPAFSSFSVESSNTITALGWRAIPHQFDAPMILTEKGKVMLVFLAPVPRQNQTIDYLVAKAAPEQVLPRLFPTEVTSSQPKDIWIMKEDGLIFYDKEEQYRGTNIFSDTLNNQSPSVVAFGRLTVSKANGVGYYSFPDNGKTIFKIAAWQTVDFPEAKSWKIVVNYAYMVRDD
ncbi:MAG: serine/threonine protein kinase, bacterial [Methylococcaceae bacterium NSP1-2]|nr:serine/threonine protein kinase [Methylococcaceae bacterium]OYV15531.1 MAG: serine/threonine protein kinase, bacterial [Methylococcaceae bacterium NSP1-2]